MYIHKSYFAQAVLTHPDDPLLSPYAASYLAAYRCASALISMKVKYFNRSADLLARRWSIWSSCGCFSLPSFTFCIAHLSLHSFLRFCTVSSSPKIVAQSFKIIAGTVAIHTRDSHLAARAFAELCLAVELFERGAMSSTRAGHGLVVEYDLPVEVTDTFSR